MIMCVALLLAFSVPLSAASLDSKLVKASKKGNCERVKELLGEGANPNAADDGASALIWALRNTTERKRLDAAASASVKDTRCVVEALLEKGAGVNTLGGNALVLAQSDISLKGEEALVLALLERGDNESWGWALTTYGFRFQWDVIMVKAIVARCREIYEEGKNCMGALAAASRLGSEESVASLLTKGASVESPDSDGVTPLMRAAGQGSEAVVRMLLERGANVNHVAIKHSVVLGTPVAYSALWGHRQVTKLLLDRGAAVDPALEFLEREARAGSEDGAAGARLLQSLTAARSAPAATAGVSKDELATIVKAAVEGAQSAGKSPAPGLAASDVDSPRFKLPERPDDFAVVVGIEGYSEIPPAQFAERDAEAVKNILMALGVPSRNVVHLSGAKAGYKALEKFVETWLPRNVNEKSRVFFYFSGHGAPDPASGEAYLLPWDGDPSFLENTGYPVRRLYEKLAALKAKEVFVALDACFSGAGGRSVLAKGARPLVTKTTAAPIAGRLVVLAAAASDQITSTREDQGHGTFTYHLLKGLGGAAADLSGAVTAKSLYGYLKPRVQDDARRQNREQVPQLQGALVDLVLAPPAKTRF